MTNQIKLVKEAEYLFAWFLFWICSTVIGAIAGFVAGAIAGFALAVAGFEDSAIHGAGGAVAGFIVGIPISYIMFRTFVAVIIVNKIAANAGPRPSETA